MSVKTMMVDIIVRMREIEGVDMYIRGRESGT